MRVTSSEDTLRSKEAYERLSSAQGGRVCTYNSDNRSFTYPQFNEAVQTCRQQISYCGVGSRHQNVIFDHVIKEFTLGISTLLIHTPRLWLESVSTMMWTVSFKA